MRTLVFILFLTLLYSCNEEDEKQARAALSNKALNSYWVEKGVSASAAFRLDLRTLNLGAAQIISFYDQDDSTVDCNCNGKMYGTDTQGFYNLDCSLCASPYDTISITAGSYKVSGEVLTLCDDPNDSNTCTDYE